MNELIKTNRSSDSSPTEYSQRIEAVPWWGENRSLTRKFQETLKEGVSHWKCSCSGCWDLGPLIRWNSQNTGHCPPGWKLEGVPLGNLNNLKGRKDQGNQHQRLKNEIFQPDHPSVKLTDNRPHTHTHRGTSNQLSDPYI